MALHLTQACFFNPILGELRGRGSNTDRLLRRANLEKFEVGNPGNYVPARHVYQLFDAICCQQGSPDLLNDFAEVVELTGLARWGEMIAYAPDVLSALYLAEKYGSVLNTHEMAGFIINGNRTTYWQKLTDNPNQKGRDQAIHIDLALAINGLKIAGGKDWAPLEIRLQSHSAPDLDVLLPPGCDTRVLLGQPATAVVFETGMIGFPMLSKDVATGETPSFSRIGSLTDRMEAVLDSLLPGNAPSLDLFVQMMDMSPRSLQRRLQGEGKTLSQVIEQWRMKTSIHLLQATGMKVKEISERLSYSNVPNFERAFRRWTQTTPNRYRNSLNS